VCTSIPRLTVRLYTWQDPAFDITNPVDHTKSSLVQEVEFARAYAWLGKQLKTNQLLWCYNGLEQHTLVHGLETVRWTLDVPNNVVLAHLDADVWSQIISEILIIQEHVIEEWTQKHGDSNEAWDALLAQQDRLEPRDQNWCRNLFVKTANPFTETVIRSPIHPSWIVEKMHASEYCFSPDAYQGFHSFTDTNELRHWIDVMSSGLNGRKIPFLLQYSPDGTAARFLTDDNSVKHSI